MSYNDIDLEDVEFGYNQSSTFLNIKNITIKQGNLVIIIGPNGTGKSTLCKLLSGIIQPTRSTKFDLPPHLPILVWQDQELFPLSVERNLRIVCKDNNKVDEVIKNYHLADVRKSYPSKLSGGQQEKLAIARALLAGITTNERNAIIFDEPTQSIDSSFIDDIASEILKINKENITVIIVTHDERLVTLLSKSKEPIEIYLLEPIAKEGQNVKQSELKGPFKLDDLYKEPPTLYAAEFARYENIYGLLNPNDEVTFRNIIPLPEKRKNFTLTVIPDEAFKLCDKPIKGSKPVTLVSREFRSGGIQVSRYKWKSGENILEAVVRINSSPPESSYLYLESSKCKKVEQ